YELRAGVQREKLNLYYVWHSAMCFCFSGIILNTCITVFQIYRPCWGTLGDYLSFTFHWIPQGTQCVTMKSY
uniref:Uncharacterized protein n=1 Tax=Sus scrofa TaxID=9823 RepID=A0A4X1TZ46_PIG